MPYLPSWLLLLPDTDRSSCQGNTVNYSGAAQTLSDEAIFNSHTFRVRYKGHSLQHDCQRRAFLEGTATVMVTAGVITYGPNATLQYNNRPQYTATAEEWDHFLLRQPVNHYYEYRAITTYAALTLNAGVPANH